MNKKSSAFDLKMPRAAGAAFGKVLSNMVRRIKRGSLDGKILRMVIVVSRFHLIVTQRLLLGALDGLRRCGVQRANIEIVWTPGAFEIPQVALRIASAKRAPHAIICLGAVIRGETPHFDYICSEAARGISRVGMKSGIPTIFGVLTTDTQNQALARAGGKHGNKGWDAAMTAVEMFNLFRQVRER